MKTISFARWYFPFWRPLSGARPSWPRTSAPTPWARLPSTAPGITSPCCPCWWFWPFQAASGRTGPRSPLRRRRPSAGSCGWAASAAAQCWPLPPTSSRQVLWPVPTAARPGSSPLCMWCWCRCSACSSGGGSACRCGSPWPCPWALCTCCVSRAASPWPPATCWCWYVPYAFPYISW